MVINILININGKLPDAVATVAMDLLTISMEPAVQTILTSAKLIAGPNYDEEGDVELRGSFLQMGDDKECDAVERITNIIESYETCVDSVTTKVVDLDEK